MTDAPSVEEPFTDETQQHEADMLGMYIFLGSEIMLFGGLFAGILAYRILHPLELIEASRRLHLWIGTANTIVLLTSSLLVALAVQQARAGSLRRASALVGAAALLGLGFLGLKGVEYAQEYEEGLLPILNGSHAFSGPVERLFMDLYLVATSLHAVHLTIGIALLLGLSWQMRRRSPEGSAASRVAVTGLYWHLVDIVWIFLFPALYLIR